MNPFRMTWSAGDIISSVIAVVFLLIIIYYLIQWMRASRNYRDSADDHALGCASTIGWGCTGCCFPVGILAVGTVVVLVLR